MPSWSFMHLRRLCWHLSAPSHPSRPFPAPLALSVAHTQTQGLHQDPSLSKTQWTERENSSSSCFEFIAPRKTRQLSSFCQCPLCSNLTEPSWVSVSRQGNFSWSAAYRLLHKNCLFAYSARDAALGMLSSHSKHSMTTIQATGAESLQGGREAKEKKNIFSGGLECYKLCLFVFGVVFFFFPNVTQKAAWVTREKKQLLYGPL